MRTRKLLFTAFVLFLSLLSLQTNAQNVSVTGATGITDGTSYATLKDALGAINGTASQTGANILVAISASTDEADLQCTLNAKDWASVKIYPTVAGVSVSGTYTGALINLNGVNHVTIDGSIGGTGVTKGLTIINITAWDAIVLQGDASNNIIKNCIIKGGSSSSSTGTIYTAAAVTTGNDNNLISNNDITNNGSGRATYAIKLLGNASMSDDNNVISNNNIYDVWNQTSTSSTLAAIFVGTGTSATKITGNSIYATSDFSINPGAACIISGINVTNTAAVADGTTITGNYIGGSAAQCGGDTLKISPALISTFGTSFTGINFTAGATTGVAHSVSNNVVKNIRIFGAALVQNMTGLKLYAPSLTANGNTIQNMKNISTGSTSSNHGIFTVASNAAGTHILSNNLVDNLVANAASGAYDPCSVTGLYQAGAGAATISSNTITNLVTTSNFGGVRIAGINIAGTNTDSTKVLISKNYINGITTPNSTGYTLNYGIRAGGAAAMGFTIDNNIVVMNDSYSSIVAGIFNRNVFAAGASASTVNSRIYYNTVYIGGTTAAPQNSYALQIYGATSRTLDVRNNLFINNRTTSNSTFKNYAVNYAAGATPASIYDYNNYYVSGVNTQLSNKGTTLSEHQAAIIGDIHSENVNPLFTNVAGIAAEDFKTNTIGTNLVATPIVGFEKDFAGYTRAIPRMGAYESSFITALQNIEQNKNLSIIANATGIMVPLTGKSSIELYSIGGMLLDKTVAEGVYTRNLNSGVYLIRVNGIAAKFVK